MPGSAFLFPHSGPSYRATRVWFSVNTRQPETALRMRSIRIPSMARSGFVACVPKAP